jgi:hypothetical protein
LSVAAGIVVVTVAVGVVAAGVVATADGVEAVVAGVPVEANVICPMSFCV